MDKNDIEFLQQMVEKAKSSKRISRATKERIMHVALKLAGTAIAQTKQAISNCNRLQEERDVLAQRNSELSFALHSYNNFFEGNA